MGYDALLFGAVIMEVIGVLSLIYLWCIVGLWGDMVV